MTDSLEVDLVSCQALFFSSSLMNPVHARWTHVLSLVADPPCDFGRSHEPLHHAVDTLIALPVTTMILGLKLGRKMVSVLLADAANKHLGACAECGASVTPSDPFIRYRGDYYHAHGCAETHPPAVSRRRNRANATR